VNLCDRTGLASPAPWRGAPRGTPAPSCTQAEALSGCRVDGPRRRFGRRGRARSGRGRDSTARGAGSAPLEAHAASSRCNSNVDDMECESSGCNRAIPRASFTPRRRLVAIAPCGARRPGSARGRAGHPSVARRRLLARRRSTGAAHDSTLGDGRPAPGCYCTLRRRSAPSPRERSRSRRPSVRGGAATARTPPFRRGNS